tara:strand:+ start:1234 stop:1611 length:378 start_codon:yes stop_codon:yes gene_type:complete
MKKTNFFLPERIPTEREQLGQLINDTYRNWGYYKSLYHAQERVFKSQYASLCSKYKGQGKGIEESKWLGLMDVDYATYSNALKETEDTMHEAYGMYLQVLHHQDDLRQERALDRVKLDKGIYDIT